ncbi:MAG: hypothetical protein AVDCRST_MAG74-1869 [uncultured Pyrinomonadaceae bacterium]|uniref:Uncharacterized protein n=1 Tax=uncultured Pyrinomonadaceae bacterium TaxID=2283094 RepID=A0A6J4P484_9BACT|nr:MAG: hypothetical protein AVDCRST_MAG74-1869 [uncultured Pyrinomonadaceae bacterium]
MTINLDLLDEESATEAIKTVAEIAEQNAVEWALVGGLAMALYGSDRTTKDIDIIADKLLPLENQGLLRQGGERYLIKTNRKAVAVDWIIRKDEFENLFRQALTEAVKINDVPILTAEWLVILKFIAGRFKDQEDAVFLLSQKNLVNRQLIKEKIINLYGKAAWGLAKHGYDRLFDLADGRTSQEERNEKDGYIDS